jgi:hypothetical protein
VAVEVQDVAPEVPAVDSILRRLADYLLAQDDSSTVDPAAIGPQLLPYVYILDIERDTHIRLRIRLTGTGIDHVFRRPLVGHHLDEFIHGPRGGDVIASFHHCARTREPLWMRQIVHLKDRAPRFVEGVAVYLESDRIYGGLVVGDLSPPGAEPGFEHAVLKRADG